MYLDGTLRWQAPEVMSGISPLTTEVDVYAFAICCVEIMTKGSLPWPFMDDDATRHDVLSALNISFLLLVLVDQLNAEEHSRPSLPMMHITTPALIELLRVCWHQDPFQRPPFSQIAADLKKLRFMAGADAEVSPNLVTSEIKQDVLVTKPSPDMHPTGLPESPCECFHDRCLENLKLIVSLSLLF